MRNKLLDIEGVISAEFDRDHDLIIDFDLKMICLETEGRLFPVLEAVPERLVVHDDYMADVPRSFEIYWKSSVSDHVLLTVGRSDEICEYFVQGCFSNQPDLLPGILSSVINTLIDEDLAIIETRHG